MSLSLLIIPLAPLFAALLALTVGRRRARLCGWLTVAGTALSFAALLLLWGRGLHLSATWFTVGDFALTVGLRLDELSWFMALVVAGVSFAVNVYAVSYMAKEEDQPRFFALMSFFAGAMLTLVLADSFVLLFMAWEMVGLASFGLIGFHYQEDEARRAAQKAFLLTRLGDFGLLIGWLLVLHLTHTTNLDALLAATARGVIPQTTLTLIALLFFTASVGKSAQLPLTAWLPDAMAGPTPVSALIHSATMVAAGVYLVLRVYPLFVAAPFALQVILWTGALTALFGALVATAQYDLKRVLAWSTVSQLGEMMLALGLAGPLAAAFHLAAHAVFKSTLFLSAGIIQHSTGSRDLRELGGLWRKLPVTASAFGVAALALAGFPPFAGFWSEEKILGRAVEANAGWGLLMLGLILLAGVYIGRAGISVFASWPNAPAPSAERPKTLMLAPVAMLAFAAFGLGFVLKDSITHTLPFAASQHELGLWRWSAMAASGAGLAIGGGRVYVAGSVPTFGVAPQLLARGLQAATQWPVRLAFLLAAGIEMIERGFDAGARLLVGAVAMLALAADQTERGFDVAARATGNFATLAANASDVAERQGFERGLDNFAALLNRAGESLRPLQSGKIYLYTLSLFVWVLLAGVLWVLIWFRT